MSEETDAFIKAGSGSKYPAVKFEKIGDQVVGTIIEEPKLKNIKTKFDIEEVPTLLITLDTVGNGNEGDFRTLFVRDSTFLLSAIGDACGEANVKGVAAGGRLAIKHHDVKDTGKGNPAKLYEAKYVPPAPATTSLDDIFAA